MSFWLLAACMATSPGPGRDRTTSDSAPAPTMSGSGSGTTPSTPSSTLSTSTPVPEVEVGVGLKVHQPLQPQDPVLVVFGGQGGFHVDVSGRVIGTGDALWVDVWVEHAGQRVAEGSTTLTLLVDYDPERLQGEFVGERAYLPDGALASVCPLGGSELTVGVRVEDMVDPSLVAEGTSRGIGVIDPAIAYACGTPTTAR